MSTTPPDTQTPPPPGPDTGPRVGWDDIKDLGRLRRVRVDRRVAGVAGGIARHLDIDPVLVRVGFVVLTFFGGVGLLLYLALWLLVPEEGRDWATIKLDRRSRTVALVAIGVLALVLLVSHGWWGNPGPFLFLVVILAVILVGTQLAGRDRSAAPPTDPAPPGPPSAPVPEPGQTATYPVAEPAPSYVVPEQPRPVNPRKKGPILFWFALATTVVALGTLAVVDLAGVDVAPSAYPATVLALSAAFLLLGSFFGRAGGLILVGLLAAAATVGTTFADHWDPHSEVVRPVSAGGVADSYSMDVGETIVDLTEVRDPRGLDGRVITVTGNLGHLEVDVPSDMTVLARTHVTGAGGMNVFGRDGGGIDTRLTEVHTAGLNAPRLTIDVTLHIGGIDVHAEPALRRP